MRKKLLGIVSGLLITSMIFTACSSTKDKSDETVTDKGVTSETVSGDKASYDTYDTGDFETTLRNKSSMSSKQGVYYELFVRSFADSDGDGIGDFNGITAKLDYLEELGIQGIWLMPINASNSYHGYDVTDYYSLNEDYGTEEDFKNLLDEAHKRNIKIVMDFVVNHTSNEHPWFKEALADKNSKYRNYYRWVEASDTVDFDADAMSSWNTKVWHEYEGDYYYGIFWEGMPDLNYNNPEVREEIKKASKKWLDMGIDGFRLDAAIHIYGDGEFNQQESQLDSNIQWWNEFASYCESINPDVYLVGEAWKDSDMLAEYVQPFDSKFDFTVAQNIISSVTYEEDGCNGKGTLAESIESILNEYAKVDKNYLDAVFASNHDQARVMSQVKTPEKAKLVASIYLTLPGNPFIYYGEELGMCGEKPDENIRTPFLWSKPGDDIPAADELIGLDTEFLSSVAGDYTTTWEKDSLNDDTQSFDVQYMDNDSMFRHYQKLIETRYLNDALVNGDFKPFDTKNDAVVGYTRESDKQKLIIIHNLSGEEVTADLTDAQYDVKSGLDIVYQPDGHVGMVGAEIKFDPYATIILECKE